MNDYLYDKNKNPQLEIIWATFWGNIPLIKELVQKDYDLNVKDRQGTFALQMACYQNNLEVAKILIENGANINQTDWWDSTPLIMAASHGYTSIVKYLLIKGADVRMLDRKGFSARSIAKYFKHIGTAKLLETVL